MPEKKCPLHPEFRYRRCLQCFQMGLRQPSDLCQHGSQKHECVDCLPLESLLKKRAFCSICGTTRVESQKICRGCSKPSLEARFLKALLPMLSHPPSGNLTLGGRACSTHKARPDCIFIGPLYAILLEIDEDFHNAYGAQCEVSRMQSMHESLQQLKGAKYCAITLRVGIKRNKEYSLSLLDECARALNTYLECFEGDSKAMHVLYIGYPANHKNALYAQQCGGVIVNAMP